MDEWSVASEHLLGCIKREPSISRAIATASGEMLPGPAGLVASADWLIGVAEAALGGIAEGPDGPRHYDAETGIWVEIDKDELSSIAAELMGWMVLTEEENKKGELVEKRRQLCSFWATRSVSVVVGALLNAIRSTRTVEQWGHQGLATKRGFLRFNGSNVEMLEHSAEHLAITREARFDISPEQFAAWRSVQPSLPYGIWSEAFERVLPGDKTIGLLEILGAAKLGMAPQFQKLIIYHGAEGTGKTTLMEQAARDVLGSEGDGWARIEIGQANQSEKSNSRFGLARLEGKRLALFDDSEGELSGGRLKQFVNTTGMVVRSAGKDAKTIPVTWGSILICNEPPKVTDLDPAAVDRLSFVKTGDDKLRGTSRARFACEVVEEYERNSILAQAIWFGIQAINRRAYTEAADDASTRTQMVSSLDDLVRVARERFRFSEAVTPVSANEVMKVLKNQLIYEGLGEVAEERCSNPVKFGMAMRRASKLAFDVDFDTLKQRKSGGIHYRLCPVDMSQN